MKPERAPDGHHVISTAAAADAPPTPRRAPGAEAAARARVPAKVVLDERGESCWEKESA